MWLNNKTNKGRSRDIGGTTSSGNRTVSLLLVLIEPEPPIFKQVYTTGTRTVYYLKTVPEPEPPIFKHVSRTGTV